jgi:hypothetical protein
MQSTHLSEKNRWYKESLVIALCLWDLSEHGQPSKKIYIVDLSESGCSDSSVGLLGNWL